MKNSTAMAILGSALILGVAIVVGLVITRSDQVATPPPPPDTRLEVELQKQREVEKALNELEAYLEDLKQVRRAMGEAFSRSDFSALMDRGNQIESLAQKMRMAAVPLATSEFELIKRDISDLQHSADELMSAARARNHEDAHHSSETLEQQLETLEKDLTRIKAEMRM